MPFPLGRLPLLAISEVIKSMDTRGIFYLSVLSKRSANLVMLSIPKNSLSADIDFRADSFQFELMPKGFIKQGAEFLPVTRRGTENRPVFTRFSTCGLLVQIEWASTFEVEKYRRKLFYYFSKIFKNSKFSISFDCYTRGEFVMEMMRFAWKNDFLLDRINFHSPICSSESIQELLNRCNNQHTSLHIMTKIPYLPNGFTCTPPPGGYKFKSLTVHDAHWVNLDDFLQCRKVFFGEGVPGLTVEYLNGLLKKVVKLECRLENFTLNLRNQSSNFAQIVRGLSDSAIEQIGRWEELEFERKDGLKLLLTFDGYLLSMTIF